MTIYGKGCISNYRNCSLSYVWYSVLYRMLTFLHVFINIPYLFLIKKAAQQGQALLGCTKCLIFVSNSNGYMKPICCIQSFIVFTLPGITVSRTVPSPSISTFWYLASTTTLPSGAISPH